MLFFLWKEERQVGGEVNLRVDDIRQVVVVAEYMVKGFGERTEYFGHLLHTKMRRTTA